MTVEKTTSIKINRKKRFRVFASICAFTLLMLCVTASFASCSDEVGGESSEEQPAAVTVRAAGLKGPTSIGLVSLMDKNDKSEAANKYEFSIYGAADELVPKIIRGEVDIASVPANLAAVLYKNTSGGVKVAAVNTLGVLYIVAKGITLESLADLRGKTVYATGKGSTPEYTLRYLLTRNGLDPDKDLTIEWKSEPTETVSILKGAEQGIAMLPQPYVAVAQSMVEGLEVEIDLNSEWTKLGEESQLITSVIVVRSEFAENHPEQLESFLTEGKQSVDYVNSNVDDAAALVGKYGIVGEEQARKAIPYCNLTFVTGASMKTRLSGYLSVLFGMAPTALGGAMPDDAFYYEAG